MSCLKPFWQRAILTGNHLSDKTTDRQPTHEQYTTTSSRIYVLLSAILYKPLCLLFYCRMFVFISYIVSFFSLYKFNRHVRKTWICEMRIFGTLLHFPHILAKCAHCIFFRIFWHFWRLSICCSKFSQSLQIINIRCWVMSEHGTDWRDGI